MTTTTSRLFTPPAALPELRPSIGYCRAIARQRGSSFYQGMRLLCEPFRTDMLILYAWLRHADDLVDDGSTNVDEKGCKLCWFSEYTCRTTEGGLPEVDTVHMAHTVPLWTAFTDLQRRRKLPIALLQASIRGQFADLTKSSYSSFEELTAYCYNVASTVGLLCIELWGYEGGADTRKLAADRGIALQLTNILRDVREDAVAGRVYLPASLTGRTLTPTDVLNGDPAVRRGVDALIAKATEYYERSAALDAQVNPRARRCLFAMTERYRRLLNKISANPDAVLTSDRRIRLGTFDKLAILSKAVLR